MVFFLSQMLEKFFIARCLNVKVNDRATAVIDNCAPHALRAFFEETMDQSTGLLAEKVSYSQYAQYALHAPSVHPVSPEWLVEESERS